MPPRSRPRVFNFWRGGGAASHPAAVPPRIPNLCYNAPMHHYHHYYGYDYSRGAVMFVTISTKPRQSVFSRINAGKAVPTEFGLMTLRELKITTLRVPEVKLSRYVLMPDHLHLLLWIKPGHEDG